MNFELTDDQARRLIRAASVYARQLAADDRAAAVALDEARHIIEKTVDGIIDKPADSYGPLGTAQEERARLIAALTQVDYLQNRLDKATGEPATTGFHEGVGPLPVVKGVAGAKDAKRRKPAAKKKPRTTKAPPK